MQLKNYYLKLRENQKKYSCKEYALEFLKMMGESLKYSSKNIENILLNPLSANGEMNLFPIGENLRKKFYEGDYHFFAALVYHIDNIDCSIFTGESLENIESYHQYFFHSKEKSLYVLYNIDIAELLLSSSSKKNHWLTYLFLLCLPEGGDSLLYNFKGVPLLSVYEVSDEMFQFLLEISEEINPNKFKQLLQTEMNYSIMLIENYLTNYITLIDSPTLENYKSFYPYDKMYAFAEKKCYPDNAVNVITKELKYMYSDFIQWSESYSNVIEDTLMRKNVVLNADEEIKKVTKF